MASTSILNRGPTLGTAAHCHAGTVNYRQRRPLRLSRDPGRIAIRGPAPVRAEEEISAISGAISPDKISVDEIEAWDPKGGPPTPLLDTVNYPKDLKEIGKEQLPQLCKEIRADVINTVSKTGGHLGASLGVVELTVALHKVFDAPEDKIVWDVGHQAYVHKVLTGRRDRMSSIRQAGGLSGFTNRAESEYDAFGAGHSSTSISAALGMAAGRDFQKKTNHCIAVIGDGAITGGMAYEALNHAGFVNKRLIVILNDNEQVSLPTQYNEGGQKPVGALSELLAKLKDGATPNLQLTEGMKEALNALPATPQYAIPTKVNELGQNVLTGTNNTNFFSGLGFDYIGPIDGHNVEELVSLFEAVKVGQVGPLLLHVRTEKGRGYLPAEAASDRMHGVGKYDVKTGQQEKAEGKIPSYTQFFADSLAAEAEANPRVIGIHAAMGGGTGMNRFEKRFPERTFDVGIAEQHAVTFAAGLASEGLIPVCAIYSSFLQRAYDQVIHDVALQNLPVRFAMDRAGLVGADGATHSGFADVTYMACVPNMVVMAPSNEAELCNAVATSIAINDRPSCFRFPRGNGIGVDLEKWGVNPDSKKGTPWEVGKGNLRKEGSARSGSLGRVALLGYGTIVNECLQAADILEQQNVSVSVADMRFCKPLDVGLLKLLLKEEHTVFITVEENTVGGFASHVLQWFLEKGLLDDGKIRVRSLMLPDYFIEHGTQALQLKEAGLTVDKIVSTAASLLAGGTDNLVLETSNVNAMSS